MNRCSILIFCFATLGCSGSDSTRQGGADVAREIRALLPEAASMPVKELKQVDTLFSSDGPPRLEYTPSLTATFAFDPLTRAPAPDKAALEAASRDFRFLDPALDFDQDQPPNPARIAEALRKAYAAFLKSETQGYATCLQPEYITDLTCKVDGDAARGVVGFKADQLYEGRVEYAARRGEKGWWIEEFVLPGHQVRLSRKSPADKWVKADVDGKE
jgi:hypothetical protein